MVHTPRLPHLRLKVRITFLLLITLLFNWVVVVAPSGTLLNVSNADTSYSFQKMAMSGDGQSIYIINSGGSIWKSSDTGTSWSSLTAAGTRNWSTIATSYDGSVVVAAESSPGKMYISTNSGTSWSELAGAGSRSWRTVTLSSDGSKIRAITSNTVKLYQSDDFGATWSENSTLPTTLNVNFNPDGTRSSNGCSNPCAVPSWAELTMSGSATKIALLVTAPGPYQSGRQLFISQDSGASWIETEGCCRDQSTTRQMASSRSDTNWTIIMGNYQSGPGYLRYDSGGGAWTRTGLRVHEVSGDGTNVNVTTWKGFAIAADGDQTIFTGAYAGWVDGQPGRTQSLFTGAISTEVAGVYQDESPGSYYNDVAISDSGTVRAALKSSTGQIIISTNSGSSFTRVKIFDLPLTPSIGSQVEYSESYTVLVSNYDPSFSWTVSTTSGTASINGSGLVTVANPVGRSTLTVRTNKSGVQEGVATFSARDLSAHRTSVATWGSLPTGASADVFSGQLFELATHPVTGEIYAGGTFTNLGGDADADYIARFDGTSWHGLVGPSGGLTSGSGYGSQGVFAIDFDAQGNLYAAGNFANAGGDAAADFLARWNGTAWSAVGASNLNGSLRDVEVLSNGKILIGGQFTAAGAVTGADYIAQWDGTTWQKFGATSLNNYVLRIAESLNGNIYIGGHFTDAGGNPLADRVAKLTGNDWAPVGGGHAALTAPVMAIAVDDRTNNDVLYVGGSFWDGSRTQGLFTFDGSTWNAIDLGFTNAVRDLTFDVRYGLFFSGWFSLDNRYASGLGVYVNATAYGIGDNNNDGSGTLSATSSAEAVLVTSDSKVIIGGSFSSVASATRTRYIAQTLTWTPPATLAPITTIRGGGSNSADEARLMDARQREAKIKAARDLMMEKLRKGETLSATLITDAKYPSFASPALDTVNQILLSQEVESRTSESVIVKIFTKYEVLQDLTQPIPQTLSAKSLISTEILPESTLSPVLTFIKLKRLPQSQRSDFAAIDLAIQEIQQKIALQKSRLAKLLKR